jgi:hypothetical protein
MNAARGLSKSAFGEAFAWKSAGPRGCTPCMSALRKSRCCCSDQIEGPDEDAMEDVRPIAAGRGDGLCEMYSGGPGGGRRGSSLMGVPRLGFW